MSTEALIPPLRELPARRLAERAEHLRAELDNSHLPLPRRRSIAIALVVLALGAVLLATPALGLRDQLGHLFGSDQRVPDPIRRYFENQSVHGPQADPADVILANQARVATAIFVDGYGKRVIWVAPTKAGGFCSTNGLCNRRLRKIPFSSILEISGPNTHSQPEPDRDVRVFLEGATVIHSAKGVAVTFEDGTIQWLQVQWVPKPIDAGFYLYELPKEHWDVGSRPVALVVEDANGNVLARDKKAAEFFRDSQRRGFAAPSNAKLTPPPPPPAPKQQTFDDPAGDAGSTLDVTRVTVTERGDSLDFEVTLAGELNWDEDGPLVAIDTDRNPDTGSGFYGTEFELAFVGGGNAREAEPVLYRANGWDFRRQRYTSAAWGGGPHSGIFSIKRSVLGLKPGQGFNLVAGSVANHPDTAPDFGTFAYQPSSGGTPPPSLGPDRRAPKLFAYDSTGIRGGAAKLHYWVLEGRGSARQVIRIFRGRRLLKTIWTPLAAVNPFATTETVWPVPPAVHGTLRYTVRSFDAAGNASTLESAALFVR